MNGAELATGVSWQGSLTKTGAGTLSRDRERWFELRGSQLIYYSEKPLGIIDLFDSVLHSEGGTQCTITGPTLKRPYTLSCSNPGHMSSLTASIDKMRANNKQATDMSREELEKQVTGLQTELNVLREARSLAATNDSEGLSDRLAAATMLNGELQTQLSEMRQQVETAQADSLSAERKAQKHTERLAAELQQARDATAQQAALQAEVESLKTSMSVLTAQLQEAQAASDAEKAEASRQLWATVSEKTSQLDALQQSFDQCSATLKQRCADLEDRSLDLAAKEEELSVSAQHIADLRKELAEAETTEQHLSAEVGRLGKALAKREDEAEEISTQLEEKNKELASARRAAGDCQEELRRVQGDVERSLGAREELERQYKASEEARLDLTQRVGEMTQRVEALQGTVGKAEGELAAALREVEVQAEAAGTLRKEQEAGVRDASALREKLVEMEALCNSLKQESDTFAAEAASLEQKNRESCRHVEECQAEVVSLKDLLEERVKAGSLLKQKSDEAAALNSNLKAQLEAADMRVAAAENDAAAVRAGVEEQTQRAAAAEAERIEIQKHLDETEDERLGLQRQVEALQREVKVASESLTSEQSDTAVLISEAQAEAAKEQYRAEEGEKQCAALRQQLEASKMKLAEMEEVATKREAEAKKLLDAVKAETDEQLKNLKAKDAETKQALEAAERKQVETQEQLEATEKKQAESEKQLESKVAEMREQLAAAGKKQSELEEQLEKVTAMKQEAHLRLNQLEADKTMAVEATKKAEAAHNEAISVLQLKLQDATQDLERVEASGVEMQQQINSLREESDAANKLAEEAQRQASSLQLEVGEKSSEIDCIRDSLDKKTSAVSSLEQQLSKAQQDLEQQTAAAIDQQAQLRRLQEHAQEMEAEKKNKMGEVEKTLASTVSDGKAAQLVLMKQLELAEAGWRNVEKCNTKLEHEVTLLKEKLVERAAEIDTLKVELEKSERRTENTSFPRQSSTSINASFGRNSNGSFGDLREQNSKLAAELSSARRDIRTLEEIVTATKMKHAKLKEQLKSLEAGSAPEVEQLQQEKKVLGEKVAGLERQMHATSTKMLRDITSESTAAQRFTEERQMWQRKLQRAEEAAATAQKSLQEQMECKVVLQSELEMAKRKPAEVDAVQAEAPAGCDPLALQNRLMQTYIDLKKALHDARDSLRKAEFSFTLDKGSCPLDVVVDSNVILEVAPNSTTEELGLRPGMAFKFVNGLPFTSLNALTQALALGDVALTVQEPMEDAVMRLEGREVLLGPTPTELQTRNSYLHEQIKVLTQRLVAAQVEVAELQVSAEALRSEEQERFEEVKTTAERLAQKEAEAEELRARIEGQQPGAEEEQPATRPVKATAWLRSKLMKNSPSQARSSADSSSPLRSPRYRARHSDSSVKENVL